MYNCLRFTVVIFNIAFLFVGLALLGIGVWIRTDKTQFDPLLGQTLMPVAAYVLIVVGVLIIFVAFTGCYGTMKESRCLLGLYFGMLVGIFVLEATAAILAFLFYDQIRPFIDKHVGMAVINKYSADGYDMVTDAIDSLHLEFKCCGFNSPYDWKNSTSYDSSVNAVPISCCKDKTEDGCRKTMDFSKIYSKGCVDSLISWLESNFKVVGGVTISVALAQLIGIVFALCLCIKAGDDDDEFI